MMRLRCLVGLHEMVEYGRIAPPPQRRQQPPPDWIEFENVFGRPAAKPLWKGHPTFVLEKCVHCPHTGYNMAWPA